MRGIIKNNYYCLVASLPEIAIDDRKLSLTVKHFLDLAGEELSEEDLKLLDYFFLPNDNARLLQLLTKKSSPVDSELPTVFTVEQMEDEIAAPDDGLLPYMNRFIADYKEGSFLYETYPENVLTWMYYDYLLASENEFVRSYAEFSMNLKNLTAALNARKYKQEIAREVIGENEFSQALRTSIAKDFGLSQDYPFVEKTVGLMSNPDLVERERGLDLLYWDLIDELTEYDYFTIERVIAFMLQLMMVERWSRMSSESGRKVFMEMVERFRKNFEFTDEFK